MDAAYSVDREDVTILSNAIDLETIRAMAPGELPGMLPARRASRGQAGCTTSRTRSNDPLHGPAGAVMPEAQLVMAGDV